MARQTYYVTRDQRHPLYKTRMLTAGVALELDAGAAALYRKLGVDMTDEAPKKKAAPAEAPAEAAPKRAPRKRKAKKTA